MTPLPSRSICVCPGPDKHRLGGVFRYGDQVLVHYDDGTTEHGVVGSSLPGKAEVKLGDGCRLSIATDKLWLVTP